MTARPFIYPLLFAVWPNVMAAQALIRGRVIDADNKRPVATAFVELVNGVSRVAGTLTDSTGAFTVRAVEAGDGVLIIRRIGYEDTRVAVRIANNDIALAPIALPPRAVPVDPVTASTLETGVLEDRLKGYYQRRLLGAGYFVSEQRLSGAGGAPLSDVLRGVPGISVSQNRSTPFGPVIMTNGNLIQNQLSPFRRGRVPQSQMPIGPCPMQLFIDGKYFSTQDGGVDVISPQNLVAVEVFRNLAEVPAEFSGIHSRCGVISVWTRRQPSSK